MKAWGNASYLHLRCKDLIESWVPWVGYGCAESLWTECSMYRCCVTSVVAAGTHVSVLMHTMHGEPRAVVDVTCICLLS